MLKLVMVRVAVSIGRYESEKGAVWDPCVSGELDPGGWEFPLGNGVVQGMLKVIESAAGVLEVTRGYPANGSGGFRGIQTVYWGQSRDVDGYRIENFGDGNQR